MTLDESCCPNSMEPLPKKSTERNNYRCETCEYWDKSQFPHKWGCNKIKRWMSYSQVDWIIRIGCYSHSDAGKAEQRIADVIDILKVAQAYDGSGIDTRRAIEDALLLLREKGE